MVQDKHEHKHSIFNKFKRIDAFALPVTLHYHDDRSSRKSYCGAIMTVALFALALYEITKHVQSIRNSEFQ